MMKFTGLNMDCLETVLEYLELSDLLNVADSCKRLNKAAELVFARNHDVDHNINYSKTSFQLLRCFGRVISKIKIIDNSWEEFHPETYRRLATYMNMYCAEHLKALAFFTERYKCDLLEYLDRPFSKLVQFDSSGCIFTERSCIKRLFPNLQSLEYYHEKDISFYNFNTNHFPNLYALEILDFNIGDPVTGLTRMMLDFLQLNPQLKQLMLLRGRNNLNTTELIRSAIDSLQNIEIFHINLASDDNANIIHMNNVKSFSIHSYLSEKISAYCLPYAFKQLDRFYILWPSADFHRSFIEPFFNFVEKHSSIKQLTLYKFDSSLPMDWSRLAKSLPLLEVIRIFDCNFSHEETIDFMAKFHMLKQFHFSRKFNSRDFDILCKQLGYKWIVEKQYKPGSVENVNIKLKRRF